MNLTDKNVLVTGANRGIGAALVDRLVQAGCGTVWAGMRNTANYEARDDRIKPVQLDVTDTESIAAATSSIAEPLHVLINNAGVLTNSAFMASADLEGAEAEMAVNYFGPLYLTRALAPALLESGAKDGAVVVNVMSTLARVTYPFCGTYCASKHALYALTMGMRAEYASRGIRVMEAYPGLTDTEMVAGLTHLDKTTPEHVASEIVRALQEDLNAVYAGEDAIAIANMLATDPAAAQAEADQYLPE